jgi:hypothetical protein
LLLYQLSIISESINEGKTGIHMDKGDGYLKFRWTEGDPKIVTLPTSMQFS